MGGYGCESSLGVTVGLAVGGVLLSFATAGIGLLFVAGASASFFTSAYICQH